MRSALRRLTARVRLRTKLGFVAAAVTLSVLAATAWATVRIFREQFVAVLAEASSHHSDVLRVLLEEQMTSNDLPHLARIVADVGREPHIAWVGVLNREGRVRITSDPARQDELLDIASPDCRVCHAHERADRRRSVTLVRDGGDVLRTTTPILNREACHRCHGAEARLNGILIVDRSLEPLQGVLLSTRTQVALGGAAAVLALLATLGYAVERIVLARLRRLREAARELGGGNLGWRAADASQDELGELARDFNAMAATLQGALARLGAERRQLDELVNGIADGVALVDVGLKLVTMNRAFRERLPDAVAASPGAPWSEVARAAGFDPADGASSVAQRALASERLEREIVRRADPRGERTEEISAQPLRDEGGRVAAVVEVWRDVTDRLELEAGLEQSERLASIGMLASGVAHEVGNPLAAIATAVEGLLRRMDDPERCDPAEVKEYLEIVRRQVFRCRDVTERLLGFARIPKRELAPFDVTVAVREVLALVSRQARAQRVEVRTSLPTPALVVAEPLLLEQVFLNLVLNALHAMPSGGVLGVDLRTPDDAVEVVISDTGPGISEAVRRHLFRPFRTGRRDGAGTGLGLFLSETLLRRCDGALSVESEPGKGAAFTVRLRRPDAPDVGARETG